MLNTAINVHVKIVYTYVIQCVQCEKYYEKHRVETQR